MRLRVLGWMVFTLVFAGSAAYAAVDASAIAKLFVRSQAITQDDVASLHTAQHEFTPEGLRKFNSKLDGFIDGKGAPSFSQEFIPQGKPVILKQDGDKVRIRISGILKQTHNGAATTYSGTFEVEAAGTPPKIADFVLRNDRTKAK